MRYKFRVWTGKEMLMVEHGADLQLNFGINDGWALWEPYKELCNHKDAELMQWTGLTDRNGKEIYEGDVVEYKDYSGGSRLFGNQPSTRDVVKWNKDTGGYKVRGMGFTFKGSDYEVIGSVYENPELIEVTK